MRLYNIVHPATFWAFFILHPVTIIFLTNNTTINYINQIYFFRPLKKTQTTHNAIRINNKKTSLYHNNQTPNFDSQNQKLYIIYPTANLSTYKKAGNLPAF